MVEKPNQRVIQTIKSFAQEYALNLVKLNKEQLTLEQRLIIEYVTHAQLGLIGWWMENGQVQTMEESKIK